MHEKFKSLLEDEYTWPAEFHFKFIVPTAELDLAQSLLDSPKVSLRASRNQKYTSLSAWIEMESSEAVVLLYEKMRQIPGVIAL